MTILKGIVNTIKGFFESDCSSNVSEQKLINSFEQVKDEFEEHLYAINENTSEIQYNYSRLYDIENKIEHVNEKIEYLTNLILEGNNRSYYDNNFSSLTKNSSSIDLNLREQEIFAFLYVKNEPINISLISEKTGLRDEIIRGYIDSMQKKGVKINFNQSEIEIDDEFKRIHTKNQIVKLSPEVLNNTAMI